MRNDLDQPAELTIWPRTTPARTALAREYPSLREALHAAFHAHSKADIQTWIITEAGDILSPSYIDTWLAMSCRSSLPRRAAV